MESARWMESSANLAESDSSGRDSVSPIESSLPPILRSLLLLLSSCEDKVNELNNSSIAATSPILSK